MKVIVIKEEDIKVLMERLELKKLRLTSRHREPIDEIHRHFHYIICNWLQEQGSSYPN